METGALREGALLPAMERNEEEEVIVMDGLCGDIEVNGTPPV